MLSARGWAAALLAGVLASGCSVLFGPEDGEKESPPPDPCEPRFRVYDRGDLIAGTLYEGIDYGQGTLTLWFRLEMALDELAEPIRLVDAAGIRLTLDRDGDAGVQLPGAPPVLFEDAGADLEPGRDHFLALRWDSQNPLSGSATLNAHAGLLLGGDHFYALEESPFEPDAGEAAIQVGDPQARALVDQLVLYRRPMPVPDDVLAHDPVRALAAEKQDSALLLGGPFDVVFATAAPRSADCDEYEARAWRQPIARDGLYPGGLLLPEISEGYFSGLAESPGAGESIYGGGYAIKDANTLTREVDVTPTGAYLLRVVAHGDGGLGAPRVVVTGLGSSGASLLELEGTADSTVREPDVLVGTFEVSSDAREVQIELSNQESGYAYFDRAQLLPNLLVNPSFEEVADEPGDPYEPPGWTLQPPLDPLESVLESEAPIHSGLHALCLRAPETPRRIRQAPPEEEMEDHAVYAAGAFFFHTEESGLPRLDVQNGSLFEVGLPYSSDDRIGVSAPPIADVWLHVAAVGRRLRRPELNAHNDLVLFGTTNAKDELTDLCVDDAYVFELDSLTGDVP